MWSRSKATVGDVLAWCSSNNSCVLCRDSTARCAFSTLRDVQVTRYTFVITQEPETGLNREGVLLKWRGYRWSAEGTDWAQVRTWRSSSMQMPGSDPRLCFWIKHSVITCFVLVFTLIFIFLQLCTNVFFHIYIYISVCLFVIGLSFSSCVFNYVLDLLTSLSQKSNHVSQHEDSQRLRVKQHRLETQFKGMFYLRLEDRETWLAWSSDIILPLCYYICYNSRVADILGYIGSSMVSCK